MNRNRSQNGTNGKLSRQEHQNNYFILYLFKKIEESMNMLRRDTGNIKRPTLNFYRWKCNLTKKKKKMYWTGFNSRLDIAEGKISELEDGDKYYPK